MGGFGQAWQASGREDVELVVADACAILGDMDLGPSDLVHSDPPYLHSTRRGRRLYRFEYEQADHVRLLQALCRLPCMVTFSSYRSALHDGALAAWRRHDFPNATQAGVVTESVWSNLQPGDVLHDHRHIRYTFREGEASRRRRANILQRIARAAPVERNAIVAELMTAFPEASAGRR